MRRGCARSSPAPNATGVRPGLNFAASGQRKADELSKGRALLALVRASASYHYLLRREAIAPDFTPENLPDPIAAASSYTETDGVGKHGSYQAKASIASALFKEIPC